MWETIQNICTVIVGIEVFAIIYFIVSLYWDIHQENENKSDDDNYESTRICGMTNKLCFHDDGWHGSCYDCPEYIEHEKKRQKEQEAKDIEQLIKKSVKEVMEEK